MQIQEESTIMPYVRFERRAVENVAKSREEGRYVGVDIDFVNVTPPGSKDVWTNKVSIWLDQLDKDKRDGRIPPEWVDKYSKAYQAWQSGQELPLEGTPIRGWGVISPAQQEALIRLNILTVEVLSSINDEGLRRIGMGAVDMRNKADAWLKQLSKAGKPTLEIASLKKENSELRTTVETLEKRLEEMAVAVKQLTARPITESIDSDDLLGDD